MSRDQDIGERTYSLEIRQRMVRKKGRLVMFIRKIGAIETHCIFLSEGKEETPILDRVKGIGGVAEDQVQDMEAISEEENTRCIGLQKAAGIARKAAMEPNLEINGGTGSVPFAELDETLQKEAVAPVAPQAQAEAPVSMPLVPCVDEMSAKKLAAIVVLEDLDVDLKGKVGDVRARIIAARAGLPDPTQQPALAE